MRSASSCIPINRPMLACAAAMSQKGTGCTPPAKTENAAVAKIGPNSFGVGICIFVAIKLPNIDKGTTTSQCIPPWFGSATLLPITCACKSQITRNGTVITTPSRRSTCITMTTLGLTSLSSSQSSIVSVMPPGSIPMMQLLRFSRASFAVIKAKAILAAKITIVASATPTSSARKLFQVSAVKVEPIP